MKSSDVVINLRRKGHKHSPVYDIIVISGHGVFLEKIGFLNVTIPERIFFLNYKRFGFWLNKGAILRVSLKKYLAKIVF